MSHRTLALLLALSAPAAAQEFIYALNTHGKVSVNGTILDSMPSGFDASTGEDEFEQWVSLDVSGPDRYALRLDGRVQKNGKKLYQFLMGSDGVSIFVWRGFDATPNGVHALRQEGLLNSNGEEIITYPRDVFVFTQLAAATELDEDTVFALRSDGTVFSGLTDEPVAKFTATSSPTPTNPADGAFFTSVWIDAAIDEVNGDLMVLRTDGKLWRIPVADIAPADGDDPPGGTEVVELPFPPLDLPPGPLPQDLYVGFSVANGDWRVLRADGAVFTDASAEEPLVDYAGSGTQEEDFFGVAAHGDDTYAVRDDGLVFKNEDADDPILNLPGGDFLAITIGTEPPDLTNFKNPQPKASPYAATVVEGNPLSVPIVVSDIEKLSDELIVTVNPDVPLPAGVTFQEVDDGLGHITRTLEWDGSGPVGTYVSKLLVDDGVNKPKKFAIKIKVLAADVDTLKNKPPKPTKVKPVQALVGFETRLLIMATDLDGDELVFSVNEEKYPFNEEGGATFDPVTREFVWTPTFDHIGKAKPKFFVSDGVKTKSVTISINVKNPLIFETEPPPPPPEP
jgi:hypothetical protein